MDSDFNYVLVSDVDEVSSFTNTCNQELDFTTPYEVCLQDMLFSIGAWDNVRPGSNVIYVEIEGRHEKVHVPPGRYTDKVRFVQAINQTLQVFAPVGGAGISFSFIAAIPAKPKEMRRVGGELINECSPYIVGDYTIPPVKAVPEYLAISYAYRLVKNDKKLKVTFCGELAYLLGMVPTVHAPPTPIAADYSTPGWKIEARKIDLTRNNLTLVWVFADFIERMGFGPTTLPLLRMVPIQAETGQLEHSMFSLQHYVPIPKTRIREFGITIRERWDGAPVKILGEVVLTLHFRKSE
jgi:hypothetical protein